MDVMMKVKYAGRLAVLTAEYNGVRYAIPRGQSKEIPIKVYDYIKSSGHIHAGELIPDIEAYKNEITELKKKILDLETANIGAKEGAKDVRKTSKKK